MDEKKKRNVKQKRPMASWAVWFLKLTQHVVLTVTVLCVVALILTNTVYIEDYGYRRWLQPSTESVEERVQSHLVSSLSANVPEIIRLATIRSQLETDGKFDSGKEINISDYYNRKEGYVNTGENYFPNAVYRLEDLIRWEQSGGLIYEGEEAAQKEEETPTVAEAASESTDVVAYSYVGQSELNSVSINFGTVPRAKNMFLTVDGRRLEELVSSPDEYKMLCMQLDSCMTDLLENYREYQQYTERYAEGNTSLVYYIDMNNENGDVFTNYESLTDYNKGALRNYFDGLMCAAAGSTALHYNIPGTYELTFDEVSYALSLYDYAFGSAALIYAGFDMELGASDYYQTIWEAYSTYSPEGAYILIGIISACALYYVMVTLYLMYASGRKVDKEGQEYIELKWTDALFTELFLGWCVLLGFGVAMLVCFTIDHFTCSRSNMISLVLAVGIAAASFVGSVFVTESLCSLSRRFKGRTLWKNSILYVFIFSKIPVLAGWLSKKWNLFSRKMQYYGERSGLWEKTWGVMLAEVLFYAVLLFLMTLFINIREPMGAFVTGVAIIGMIIIMSYRRMRRKVERSQIVEKIEGIVAGESCRVDEEHLSLENAALGHAVNEIGEGIQKAVETSIKDERLKAELLTNVSHDIKTPLTSIINYVDLLKKEHIESPKAQEYISILESKSLKLKNLIQDLIEVSKISTGNIEYEMMPIHFHELILQAVAEYEDKFAEHCLKLIYNNDVQDGVILADSRRIWRVMENLLSNIYKYALEGTRVYVEVSKVEENLVLVMKNISAKELKIQVDELTERFVRGDVSRTTEGSGLGLAIAQNLVIGQGGSFQIMMDGDLFKVKIAFKFLDFS